MPKRLSGSSWFSERTGYPRPVLLYCVRHFPINLPQTLDFAVFRLFRYTSGFARRRAQTKSRLSHKNKFPRKSCPKCGLSPFFHRCLQLSFGTALLQHVSVNVYGRSATTRRRGTCKSDCDCYRYRNCQKLETCRLQQ